MKSEKVICATCSRSFTYKYNLIRHIRTVHSSKIQVNSNIFLSQQVFFECAKCNKKFTRKDSLIYHHKRCFFEELQQKLFECGNCKKKYYRENTLRRHLKNHCQNRNTRIYKTSKQRIICIVCGSQFPSKKCLYEHYKIDHHVQLQYENIHFESYKKFEEWKNNLEQETICQFRKYLDYKCKTKVTIRYNCHRSGIYESKAKGAVRKRSMKLNGSKRIGGYCPADITVFCNRTDNSCTVTFQKVHIGHEIGSEHELKHVWLSKEEKMKLAAKLNLGVTAAEVVSRHSLCDTDTNTEAEKPDVINNADIYNVTIKCVTDDRTFIFGNDDLNVQSFVMQNSESILYFKDKWKDDEKYGLLKSSDYMIVIMDAVQEKNLLRYGHKVIAIDSAYGNNSQCYILHTLLIVNVDFEGFPVAFALTNRNDYDGISVFIQCIKDKVGILKTRILMSDMRLTYYNCWSNIMQPPEKYLYCIWHVYDQWKKNLNKISNIERKKEIKKELYGLATEMDIDVFERDLQSFLLNIDDHTEDFLKYFSTYYAVTREKWAYCYRPDAEMNTNMYIERFRNAFKKNMTRGKKITTVACCLKYIFEYLRTREKDYLYKELRANVSHKLRNVRSRHKTAEKELATIQRTSHNTWLISSFTEDSPAPQMYTVKRREQDTVECAGDCNLVCVQCQTCFHQYKCTCHDSNVHNNMCKHIHILGINGVRENATCSTADVSTVMHTDDETFDSFSCTVTDVAEEILPIKAEELKNEVEKAKNLFAEALQYATNVKQVRDIINRHVVPIKPTLLAANMSAPTD